MNLVMLEMTRMFELLNDAEVKCAVNILANYRISTSTGYPTVSKNPVIGLGAGRMGYSLRAFMMRLSHLGFNTYQIGDTALPRINSKSLVIVNSSSGETSSILAYTKQAYDVDANIISFTCNKDSSIAKLSDHVVVIPTISTRQLMKSCYEQFTMLLFDLIVEQYVNTYQLNRSEITHNHSILE